MKTEFLFQIAMGSSGVGAGLIGYLLMKALYNLFPERTAKFKKYDIKIAAIILILQFIAIIALLVASTVV